MMESVESVVVRQRYVGAVVQKKCEHVVSFLRNGIVQRSVAFRILKQTEKRSHFIHFASNILRRIIIQLAKRAARRVSRYSSIVAVY